MWCWTYNNHLINHTLPGWKPGRHIWTMWYRTHIPLMYFMNYNKHLPGCKPGGHIWIMWYRTHIPLMYFMNYNKHWPGFNPRRHISELCNIGHTFPTCILCTINKTFTWLKPWRHILTMWYRTYILFVYFIIYNQQLPVCTCQTNMYI